MQEDAKELIAEHGRVVRRHFQLYNVLIKFDEDLVKITEGKEKRIVFTFLNRLFTPQYLNIRILDIPSDWTVNGGNEFCVGIEHWHGSTNSNSYTFEFTPGKFTKGKYTLIMEINSSGRMTRNYIPLTFINGSCR